MNGIGKFSMIFSRRFNRFFFALVFALMVFSSGIYIDHYRVFPYELFSDGYKYLKLRVFFADAGASNKIIVTKQQISDLMTIRARGDVPARRELLRQFIWKGVSPKDFSLAVTPMETPASLKDCAIASRKLVLDMPYGFTSVMKLYESRERRDRLVIYHRGHNVRDKSDMDNVLALCEGGFDVLLLDLPMLGDNSNPTVPLDNIGRVAFSNHDQLKYLESDSFNPLVLFMAPLAKAIDHAMSLRAYKDISLIGISGGAAVITMYAALDDRVKSTFAVAGVAPMFLRFAVPETYWGDYEQTVPGLAKIVTDLDMYVLAAFGQSRQYVQIYNQHDPCCFPGAEFKTYSSDVSERVRQLGYGSYDAWLDTKNLKHGISKEILLRIIQSALSSGTTSTEVEHGVQ